MAQDNAAHSTECQVHVQQYDTAVTGNMADSAGAIAADTSILAVIGPTYGAEAVNALPVLQAGGVAVISPSASDSDRTTKGWTVFRQSAGNAGHGTYATCPCIRTLKGVDTFRSQYTARYGDSPSFYAPEAYDAARIALAGLRTGVTSRAAMLAFVNGWGADGLGRHVKFGAGGGLAVDDPNVWIYKSGSDGYFAGLTAMG